MQISLEEYSDELVEELMPFFEKNATETGIVGTDVNISFETYQALHDLGFLRIFVLRDREVKGYAVYTISSFAQDTNKILATQHVIFVDTIERGRYGSFLADYCEKELSREADYIVVETTLVRDLSKILERKGYKLKAKTFFKELK